MLKFNGVTLKISNTFMTLCWLAWQYHDGVPRVICVWPRALISGRPKWCYLTSSILDSMLALNLLKFLCKYRNTNPRYMCYFFNHVGERLLDIVAQCILGPRLSRSLNTQAVIRWPVQPSWSIKAGLSNGIRKDFCNLEYSFLWGVGSQIRFTPEKKIKEITKS